MGYASILLIKNTRLNVNCNLGVRPLKRLCPLTYNTSQQSQHSENYISEQTLELR